MSKPGMIRGAPPWFVPPTPEELIALKEKHAQMKATSSRELPDPKPGQVWTTNYRFVSPRCVMTVGKTVDYKKDNSNFVQRCSIGAWRAWVIKNAATLKEIPNEF